MKKGKLISIIIASVLVCAGMIVFLIGAALAGFNFDDIYDNKYETVTLNVEDKFTDIDISTEVECDIYLFKSDDGTCRIECVQSDKIEHRATVKNGELVVTRTDTRKWYERIGFFSWRSAKLSVYLPEEVYDTLELKTVSGDITVPGDFTFRDVSAESTSGDIKFDAKAEHGISCKTVSGDIFVSGSEGRTNLKTTSGDVRVSNINTDSDVLVDTTSGDIEISDIKAGTFSILTTSGDISLRNALASGNVNITAVSGDIRMISCDAETFYVKTVSGDVSGDILSPKFFETHTTSGDVRVPQSDRNAGTFEVHTTSGDIRIDVR